MKKLSILAALAIAAAVTPAMAQVTITTPLALDFSVANAGPTSTFSGAYSAVDDVFLIGTSTYLTTHSGTTGADGADLDTTGLTVAGLGFFATIVADDGRIFSYINNTNNDIATWTNAAAVPTIAATGAAFARTGQAIGSGVNTELWFTGSASAGPIQRYTTTDGVTFTLATTIAAGAKSALEVNAAGSTIYTTPDSPGAIGKWDGDKTNPTWVQDAGFTPVAGAANSSVIALDETNGILFSAGGANLNAMDPATGADLLTAPVTLTNAFSNTVGYGGSFITTAAGSGTVWFAGRNTTSANANLIKFAYGATGVKDWAVY